MNNEKSIDYGRFHAKHVYIFKEKKNTDLLLLNRWQSKSFCEFTSSREENQMTLRENIGEGIEKLKLGT